MIRHIITAKYRLERKAAPGGGAVMALLFDYGVRPFSSSNRINIAFPDTAQAGNCHSLVIAPRRSSVRTISSYSKVAA